MHTFQREDSMISPAGVIDHEAQYGDDDYLCYADHRSDNLNNTGTLEFVKTNCPSCPLQSFWSALGVADGGILHPRRRLGLLSAKPAPELVRGELRVAQLSAQPRGRSVAGRHPPVAQAQQRCCAQQ